MRMKLKEHCEAVELLLWRALRWCALILLSACGTDTVSLRVDLRTDLAPGAEITDVQLRISDARPVDEITHSMEIGGDYLAGVRVAVFEELSPGTYRVEVSARSHGAVIVERDVTVLARRDSAVTVVLTRSCREVVCAEGQSCLAGRCESNRCAPERPDECTLPPQCTADEDCGGAASECGRARCVEGSCFVAGAPSTGCAPGTWCVPTDGCRPQSTEPTCIDDPLADPEALAVYSFDDDRGTSIASDARGAHDGILGDAIFVSGPQGCGAALAFDSAEDVVVIPDSPDFDLVEGSVDVYLRHEGTEAFRVFLSRDAVDTARAGHFTAALLADHRVAVRIQHMDLQAHVCSQPLTANQWHHVGINFGSPGIQIWVDGAPSEATGESSALIRCGEDAPLGLAGARGENDNPWYLGASRGFAPEGETVPATDPFIGAMDHLRLSTVRRDFSPYAL